MKKIWMILIFMLLLIGLSGCDLFLPQPEEPETGDNNRPEDNEPIDPIDAELRVYFLDVGQGDAVFIQFPEGETMLIDAGRHNLTHNTFRSRIREFFPSNSRMQFDWFITTHSHADHIGSAAYIVNNSYIQNIVRPITFTQAEVNSGAYTYFGILAGTARMHQTVTFQNFVNAMNGSTWINGDDTNIKLPYAGKTFEVGTINPAVVTFYSPTTHNYGGSMNVNHYSTIFCIYFAGRRLLFTGDAYQVNELRVLDTLPTNVDVLDVGHHGSHTSTAAAFLSHIQPTYAVIQVGNPTTGNTYGHPHQVVLNRLNNAGVTIMRTDQLGDILVQINLESQLQIGSLN